MLYEVITIEVLLEKSGALFIYQGQRRILPGEVVFILRDLHLMDNCKEFGRVRQVALVVQGFTRQIFHDQDAALEELPRIIDKIGAGSNPAST